MNAGRLLAQYELIADAPDAIARLRRFILDLAVRGKLVPQDPRDDPASDLLNAIVAKRKKLAESGIVRPAKSLVEKSSLERLFELPCGWVWTNANQMWDFENGDRSKNYPSRDQLVTEGVPFVNAGHLEDGLVSMKDMNFISRAKFNQLGGGKLRLGDQLYCLRGSLGKHAVFLHEGDAAIASSLIILRPIEPETVPFLSRYLDSDIALTMLRRFDNGTAQPNLSSANLRHYEIPLPPMAEQCRIVGKVDELMALCDQLEAARAERETSRDRLAAASLGRLNAPDPETFQADARFALDALPALAARPDQIKQLRHTILNLAVRGKLVPSDPNDESASVLATRILDQQWQKKRNPRDVEPDRVAIETVFLLPPTWEWASVNLLVRPNETVTYGILKPEWVSEGVPTVRVTEMKTGTIDLAALPKCDPARAAKFNKTTLTADDLLVSKDGTIGKTAFVPPELEGGNITQHVLRFPITPLVNRHFIRLAIDSPFCQSWMAGETKGVALQGVNVGDFRRMPIPLPPLAEQDRIVAKVDALIALCDRLESSLTATAVIRRCLLDALLAEALAPAEDRELQAAE